MASDDMTITYILRCHSVSTLPKLKTALFSVSAQRYTAVKALVAMQNLPDDDVEQIVAAVQLLQRATGLFISLENFSFSTDGDHRGELLNRALEKVQSRYVAFLDYDDVVYPNHAETLIGDLAECENQRIVASFGGCTIAYYDDIGDDAIYITRKHLFVQKPTVSSCLIGNCFPIHCYVLDLARINQVPQFGEQSSMFEDYIFLLELFENYSVSIRHARTALCEYRLNNNNSNTVAVNTKTADEDPEKANLWIRAQNSVEHQKVGRSFRVPYNEILNYSENQILSRQPFLRGMFVCLVAKKIRKKSGMDEAAKFLKNPKRYSRALPRENRLFLMRLFF